MTAIQSLLNGGNKMGLENGIVIRTESEMSIFENLPKSLNGGEIEYEIAIWCRCYGIRSNILAIYRSNHHIETKNIFQFALNVDDLKDIQWFLHQCAISKRYFDDQTNTTIDYETLKPVLEKQVEALELVIAQKIKLGDKLKVYFYDSY